VNKFNRLYFVPGMGHCAGVGSAGTTASANTVPLPATDQFFNALKTWVEGNTAPASIVLNSANSSVSLPVCPYPQKPTYSGTGSPTAASSYSCH
jgi:feruloyl esterase